MVREDGKRNFVLREEDGSESSVFSGSMPRQAALKAARRLEPRESEDEAKEHATEIHLREKGTDKVHIFHAWAWVDDAPGDKPDWMEGDITKGNVSKQGIEHLDE
ncbi:non-histone chromosomal MC1 family protein [Halogeometricum sp. S1BR25-6]|uniref:Non-histone chromosomal MC1 family protein n=1 Tax=Halogeometricum salsisoli TaxID=2950536 RepID=A0ABU2G8I5_9EURY|nr:non-histone chromosomal MC1 family protein [Halogeometricum sp. S1BR25-6]MDS0297121.1 non-histone chromosomal MC1 family protein [Halogeometricum sp. S1BR25-6]